MTRISAQAEAPYGLHTCCSVCNIICVFPAKLAINFPGLNQIETVHVIIKIFSPGSQFETQHGLKSFHVISFQPGLTRFPGLKFQPGLRIKSY
jgi:hypothetical protein